MMRVGPNADGGVIPRAGRGAGLLVMTLEGRLVVGEAMSPKGSMGIPAGIFGVLRPVGERGGSEEEEEEEMADEGW